jgi:hypothetical protein
MALLDKCCVARIDVTTCASLSGILFGFLVNQLVRALTPPSAARRASKGAASSVTDHRQGQNRAD